MENEIATNVRYLLGFHPDPYVLVSSVSFSLIGEIYDKCVAGTYFTKQTCERPVSTPFKSGIGLEISRSLRPG